MNALGYGSPGPQALGSDRKTFALETWENKSRTCVVRQAIPGIVPSQSSPPHARCFLELCSLELGKPVCRAHGQRERVFSAGRGLLQEHGAGVRAGLVLAPRSCPLLTHGVQAPQGRKEMLSYRGAKNKLLVLVLF